MFDANGTQTFDPDEYASDQVVSMRCTDNGKEYPLDAGERRWVLGTSASCDIVLDDPFVSALHCTIERKPDGAVVVRDRKSRNGTQVDRAVIEAAELRVGACLKVGNTKLVAMSAKKGERATAIEALRGHDPTFRRAVDQALRAAHADCNVLVVGETGTGKDLLARAVHEASRRARNRFVPVNCGAIPRELIGSELFGHEKGAFTGASHDRDGFFVEAHGGTLFLDELGELPLEMQPNLLRVLETRCVRRVGGQSERNVDVRIIAATNRLDGLGTEGSRIRVDLYHRLATVVLVLPPLRERMGDMVELVQTILAELAPETGKKTITDDAWKALACYGWPGNVRELRHAVMRAAHLGGRELGPFDFFPEMRFGKQSAGLPRMIRSDNLVPYHSLLRGAMEQALLVHGSIRAAAAHLGMAKSTFADKARAWGLTPPPRAKSNGLVELHNRPALDAGVSDDSRPLPEAGDSTRVDEE